MTILKTWLLNLPIKLSYESGVVLNAIQAN